MCNPNVYLRFGADSIDLVSRRALCSGAELTIDYLINNQERDSWPGRCGADRCRGETAKSFWSLPEEFRRDYRPLLAPWFLKRYASKRDSIAP
ncbi:MAG: hypothetical protein HOL98_10585 [Gammaproteobacteria bacterium]|nr:hypothetical protein [Gammaproteobacteria bacterium]